MRSKEWRSEVKTDFERANDILGWVDALVSTGQLDESQREYFVSAFNPRFTLSDLRVMQAKHAFLKTKLNGHLESFDMASQLMDRNSGQALSLSEYLNLNNDNLVTLIESISI